MKSGWNSGEPQSRELWVLISRRTSSLRSKAARSSAVTPRRVVSSMTRARPQSISSGSDLDAPARVEKMTRRVHVRAGVRAHVHAWTHSSCRPGPGA